MLKKEDNKSVFVTYSDLMALKKKGGIGSVDLNKKNRSVSSGEQKSFLKTKGMNFEEVREYQQGDDARQIDWRITAKQGRPFTKVFVDDTIQHVYILTDLRQGMRFASAGDFKSVVASKLMAQIAWATLARKNALHPVFLLPNMVKTYETISTEGNLSGLFKEVESFSLTEEKTDTTVLQQGLDHIKKEVHAGSIVIVLSDFSDAGEAVQKELSKLAQKHTLLLVHIYDPMERDLPSGILGFSDGAQTQIIDTRLARMRDAFRAEFDSKERDLKEFSKRYNISYLALKTIDDYVLSLIHFLETEGKKYG